MICDDISEFESYMASHAVGLFERCNVEFGTRKAGTLKVAAEACLLKQKSPNNRNADGWPMRRAKRKEESDG